MEATQQQRRLRVNFQDRGILTKTQKKSGLKHSWVLLKPQFQTISDVIAYLLHSFDLHHSCPNGIVLYMDGFALPPFESTTILKDKDVISVKRLGLGISGTMKAIEEARPFIEDEIVLRQPLPSAVRLLANEEFDKETGGYLSEIDKDEDEAEEPVQIARGGDVASKKRKASSSIENSKKKRQRQVTPKRVEKKVVDQLTKTLQKKRKLANGSKHDGTVDCAKNSDPISKSDGTVNCAKNSDQISKSDGTINCAKNSDPISKSNVHEEKKEETVQASGVPNGAKKVSRGTRRKRLQRQWKKVHPDKAKVDEGEKQLPAKDLNKDSGSKKDASTNIEQLAEEDSDADGDLVPVEIRPGHIRFTPTGKATDIQKFHEASGGNVPSVQKSAWEDDTAQKNVCDVNNKVAKEPYSWNGITNKREGQKWGTENQPNSCKEYRDYNGYSSSSRANRNQRTYSWKEPRDRNTWTSRKQRANDSSMIFEKLVPLTDLPEVGDVLAYRLLELSSTWCPELTSFRVGRITCFDKESNKIIMVPEPEYPLNLKKEEGDHDDDDDSGQPPQPSLYNEDGSLEIDFPSLVDVRILKRGDPSQSKATGVPAVAIGTSAPSGWSKGNNIDGSSNGASDVGNQELGTPGASGVSESNKKDGSNGALDTSNQELQKPAATPANGKKDVWEEISDALLAKKSQLSQEDRWNKKEPSAKRSWSYRTLRGSALGPTMARLRAQNGL
ncbi:coilin-like [Chenopodium quinoa]|uniref:coilin-like n=1 Tax=Chenopodium quinoa TaxID=63459 RepID=UPI000B771BDC|nr:coilin-like [Chenopodium quinoa]